MNSVETYKKLKKYLAAIIGSETFAFDAQFVKEIVVAPKTVRLPLTPNFVRGIFNLRGKIIPLIDFRIILGQESNASKIGDLINILNQREQDHLNWLKNLRNAVDNDVPFTGQLDPHKCAFGVWYDSFHSDDTYIEQIMTRFDAPHKAIHAIGSEVMELVANGQKGKAHAVISQTENTKLAVLLTTFSQAREIIQERSKEVAIILEKDGVMIAVTADLAAQVCNLSPDDFQTDALNSIKEGACSEKQLIYATTVWKKDGIESILSIIDIDFFFNKHQSSF